MSSSLARRRVMLGGAAVLASAAASFVSVKARVDLPTAPTVRPLNRTCDVLEWGSA